MVILGLLPFTGICRQRFYKRQILSSSQKMVILEIFGCKLGLNFSIVFFFWNLLIPTQKIAQKSRPLFTIINEECL